ncbi:hypothetical protein [Streptomyces sp. NPDC048106]|uniref:hypothetical protein n=1 Tax=Streptomyces sp. NPDC048106 TaxID=3155750 RepID=UPI003457010A
MSRSTWVTAVTAAFVASVTAGSGTAGAQSAVPAAAASRGAHPVVASGAAAVPSIGPGWSAAALPVSGTVLTGVAQPDAGTTWAAGFRLTPAGKGSLHAPVLLTRQGSAPQGWTETPTAPLPAGAETRFNAVTALPRGGGWLVGDGSAQAGGIVTEHWDGTSWTLVAAPLPDNTYADDAGMVSVSGRAADDAWAVGYVQLLDGTGTAPDGHTLYVTHQAGLAEHWDGTAWTAVRLPEVGGGFLLTGVTEIAADDVWAVGKDDDDQPLLLHFDGHAWRRIATPSYAGVGGALNAVAAGGPDDVWAVGRVTRDDADAGHALVLHWDGRGWRQVAAPEEAGRLSAVAVTDQGVVAVGRDATADYPGPGADGYAIRLSGGRWCSLGLPSGTLFDPSGVAVSPQRQITAVGVVADPGQSEPQPMVLTSGG